MSSVFALTLFLPEQKQGCCWICAAKSVFSPPLCPARKAAFGLKCISARTAVDSLHLWAQVVVVMGQVEKEGWGGATGILAWVSFTFIFFFFRILFFIWWFTGLFV